MPPSTRPTPLHRLAPPASDLELFAIPEVARRLSLSRDTVYALIRAGSLRAVTVAGKMRVKPSDLAAYIGRLT